MTICKSEVLINRTDSEKTRWPEKEERIALTDSLCAKISEFNGGLTPDQVREALLGGRPVYTSFSRYQMAG